MKKEKGRFEIFDTFKITGRGIVFTGTILDGLINLGDFIQFEFNGEILEKKIIGIDTEIRVAENKPTTGILLKCESEAEIDELRNWNPDLTIGTVISR